MTADEFWRKVNKDGPIPKSCPERGPCWLWTGCTNKYGYGQTSINWKQMGTHRAAWIFEFGEIPPGRLVCHHCDNPPCCNPGHFFLGECSQDNSDDMVRKGRQSQGQKHSDAITPNRPRGSDNAMSKFTEEQVTEMRRLRKETNMSVKDIAKQFNGSYGGVQKAIRGEGWTHIAEPPAPGRHFQKYSDETIATVRLMRSNGDTVKAIAAHLGLSIWACNNMIYGNNRGS